MGALVQWFNDVLSVFKTIQIKDIIDIIAITFIIFGIFRLVRETRAVQLLKGVAILLVFYITSLAFNLTMMTSLMRLFFEFSVILIAVVFQPEIRKALEKIGQNNISKKYLSFIFKNGKTDEDVKALKKAIIDVSDAATLFSSSKTGALVVFERNVMLSDIASTGTVLNSQPSVALLGNLFFNKAPLHDGATIIRNGLVYASGCILPLTENKNIDINLGTRHRAAIGMSEISDAIVVVVSEETGVISIACNGKLRRNFNRETLVAALEDYLIEDTKVYVKKSSKTSSKRKVNDDEK
ncbi:MAG: diadenylate cyclase CdaA [Ruminococcus sp.]